MTGQSVLQDTGAQDTEPSSYSTHPNVEESASLTVESVPVLLTPVVIDQLMIPAKKLKEFAECPEPDPAEEEMI